MKRSTEPCQRVAALDLCQPRDFAGFCCWSLRAWVKVKEMVGAIGAEATQSSSGVGSSEDFKSGEWVRCEHSYEAVGKDDTRTLMHGSVRTHCTAQARVCGVKVRRRVMHVVGVRQVGQHSYRQCANQPALRELDYCSRQTPSSLRLDMLGSLGPLTYLSTTFTELMSRNVS